jgi:hypothetical protein
MIFTITFDMVRVKQSKFDWDRVVFRFLGIPVFTIWRQKL